MSETFEERFGRFEQETQVMAELGGHANFHSVWVCPDKAGNYAGFIRKVLTKEERKETNWSVNVGLIQFFEEANDEGYNCCIVIPGGRLWQYKFGTHNLVGPIKGVGSNNYLWLLPDSCFVPVQ